MRALTRPDIPPGPIRTLFDALHDLHHQAGRPSLRAIARAIGCSHTTVSAVFSKPYVPRWELLELVTEYLGGSPEVMRRLWYLASREEEMPQKFTSDRGVGEENQDSESTASESATPTWGLRGTSSLAPNQTVIISSVTPAHISQPKDDLYRQLREMMTRQGSASVVTEADSLARTVGDSDSRMVGLLFQIGGLANLENIERCAPLLVQASNVVHARMDPCLVGEYHTLAAYSAYRSGALERALAHVTSSGRILVRAVPSLQAADAWHDLAEVYSLMCLYGQALTSLQRSVRVAATAGLSRLAVFAPYVKIRYALSLDHRGDTLGCVHVLRDVLEEAAYVASSNEVAWRFSQPYLEFAAARLSAIGYHSAPPQVAFNNNYQTEGLLTGGITALTSICKLIASGKPTEALASIDSTEILDDSLGKIELLRLRSLALASAKRHREALEVERHRLWITARQTDRLCDVLLDKIAASSDEPPLLGLVQPYSSIGLSDFLTGLPGRRGMEHAFIEAVTGGRTGILLCLTMDSYMHLVQGHGQASVDSLLLEMASLLSREIDRADILARTDTNEFSILFLDSGASLHEKIRRLANILSEQSWPALLPGTKVSLSLGWTEVSKYMDFETAYQQSRMR